MRYSVYVEERSQRDLQGFFSVLKKTFVDRDMLILKSSEEHCVLIIGLQSLMSSTGKLQNMALKYLGLLQLSSKTDNFILNHYFR